MGTLLFIICFAASCVGSVTGIGGGVMIKPLTDVLQILNAEQASFLSGCTVLAMSSVSMLKRRKLNVRFDVKGSSALAVGTAIGGIFGKYIFRIITGRLNNEFVLIIQSAVLAVLTIAVFVYMLLKHRIRTFNIKSIAVCCDVGLFLGVFSSFLGIGGGPVNLMVLSLFFSMDAKEAAGT